MKTTFLQTPLPPQLLAGFWSFAEQNDLSPSVALRRTVAHLLSHAGYPVEDYDPAQERSNDYAQWARRRRPKIELEGPHPILIARVTPGMKTAFEQYAAARDRTPSDTLHALVQHVVKTAGIEVGDLTPPASPPLRAERITLRLSEHEMKAAAAHAQEFGSVREWMVAVVRAKLFPSQTQVTTNEVIALHESNRALWAIGHNVNQIARAINLDMRQAGRLEGSAARVRELEDLKTQIDAHTQTVIALCNASTSRWIES